MPSEGRPVPIDTAIITAPSDVPSSSVWVISDRLEQLRTANDSGSAIAALALATALQRRCAEQQPELVRAALRHGGSWDEVQHALDADSRELRREFLSWAEGLLGEERAEAFRLAEQADK